MSDQGHNQEAALFDLQTLVDVMLEIFCEQVEITPLDSDSRPTISSRADHRGAVLVSVQEDPRLVIDPVIHTTRTTRAALTCPESTRNFSAWWNAGNDGTFFR